MGFMQKKSLALPLVIFIILVITIIKTTNSSLSRDSNEKFLNDYSRHALLKAPSRIDKISENSYLISDSGNKRLVTITKPHDITWTYSLPAKFSMASQTGSTLLMDDGMYPLEISKIGALTWKGSAGFEHIQNVQKTPPGTIIYYTGEEIREINKNNTILWQLKVKTPFVSVQNDNTLLYFDEKHNLMSVSANRNEIWKIIHNQDEITWAEKAAGGIYLVAAYNKILSYVSLYSGTGSVLKTVKSYENTKNPLFIKPSFVHITDDNTILLTDVSYAKEITWDGSVVWQY